MNRFFTTIFCLTALLASTVVRADDVPNVMTSQGILRNAAGIVVNGVYAIKFKLYDAEEDGQLLWSELQNNVQVENGIYTSVLGKISPLPASLFSQNASAWLGVSVEGEQELPRVQATSLAYAFHSRTASSAQGLDCTGCITDEMLGFDPVAEDDVVQMVKDSGQFVETANGLVKGGLDVMGTVTAATFVGDGSGLTGISSPQGSCADGWLVAGIDPDGTLQCVQAAAAINSVDGLSGGTINGDLEVGGTLTVNGAEVCTDDANCGETLALLSCDPDQVAMWDGQTWTCSEFLTEFDPSALPADGIDEVSNDLLHNQFLDPYVSNNTPVQIKDHFPLGSSDSIVIPDAGVAQELTVSINVTNSDLSTVTVKLFDPDNKEYILYEEDGPGEELGATYPNPTPTKSGDLTNWVGKNPQGTWLLTVIDNGFKNVEFDGQINSWSIKVKTLSDKKIHLTGDLYVDGGITTKGDLTFDGDAVIKGGLTIGNDSSECTADNKGTMRYNGDRIQWCDGISWTSLVKGATYRWAVFSTYGQAHGQWYANNEPNMFGGVSAHNWTDGNYQAQHMSSDSDILRTLFVRKGPDIGTLKNATVFADEWYSYSSTNGQVVITLFRIKNTTNQNINWNAYWYRTAYHGWAEKASIALNGSYIWDSGGSNYGPGHTSSHTITIPANRTSTVIFVATSSSDSGTRSTFMAFYNNCLNLPDGLEFIDDLDTKPNGWDN